MPSDTLQVLQNLAARLGRQPTLEELYGELGVQPAGQPLLPASALPGPAVLAPSERLPAEAAGEDARVTGELRLRELSAQSPEILKLRELMVQQMLFGLPAGLAGDGFPWFLLRGAGGRGGTAPFSPPAQPGPPPPPPASGGGAAVGLSSGPALHTRRRR